MEIKTKYNIGDKVYYLSLSNNDIAYDTIDHINISINNGGDVAVHYRFSNDDRIIWVIEEEVFSTKEEILKSL